MRFPVCVNCFGDGTARRPICSSRSREKQDPPPLTKIEAVAQAEAHSHDEDRLKQAERQGLRLAIICRTVAVGAAFAWVGGAWAFLGFYPNPLVFVLLGAFTAIGIAHACVIGTR